MGRPNGFPRSLFTIAIVKNICCLSLLVEPDQIPSHSKDVLSPATLIVITIKEGQGQGER